MIGGTEYRAGSIQSIGFGYVLGGSIAPAEIGFVDSNTSGNTQGDIVFANRNGIANVAPTEVMRITSAGKVGIGTSPGLKLDVLDSTSTDRVMTLRRGVQAIDGTWSMHSGRRIW